MKLADLSKAIDSFVAEQLAEDGFRKRRGTLMLDLDTDKDSAGWLGLNRAIRQGDGVVHINPVVGVWNKSVEDMIKELHPKETPSKWITPTISTQIGYIGPEESFKQWDFRDEDDLKRVGASLVGVIRTHAVPFMEQHGALPEIIEALRSGMSPVPEQRAEKLIAALQLAGDTEAAASEVETLRSSLGDRDDPAAQRAHELIDNFRAKYLA